MRDIAAPDRQVPVRRLDLESTFDDVPRHFAGGADGAGGDLIQSHVWMCLSGIFPDGEDFFVRSVRHYRDHIDDPTLKRQVAGFIGQEVMHGREHRGLNERLDRHGYPVKHIEKWNRRWLEFQSRSLSPQFNLALTVALEHVTATLAELILTDADMRNRIGHPAVRDLLAWHALEESEHKAVAFDVYRSVGGSERVRVLTMRVLRFEMLLGLGLGTTVSVLFDRATYRPGVLRRSIRAFRSWNLISRQTWARLKDFERPGFHPDDRDTSTMLATWRAELFGDDGTLKDRLDTPSQRRNP